MSPTLLQLDSLPSSRNKLDRVPVVSHSEAKAKQMRSSDAVDIFISLDDDNSCETYFSCRDTCPTSRSVLPEGSEAFREALDKLRIESTKTEAKKIEKTKVVSAPSSKTFSAPQKAINNSKSSTSPQVAPPISTTSPRTTQPTDNKTLKPPRVPSGRRPASFGGADLVKPQTAVRRASHFEKRVSWADEKDHQLASVRLIKPRLSLDTNLGMSSCPGQSILRNTGT